LVSRRPGLLFVWCLLLLIGAVLFEIVLPELILSVEGLAATTSVLTLFILLLRH
jgi:hypothetical protein